MNLKQSYKITLDYLRTQLRGRILFLAILFSVLFFLFAGLITNIGIFFESFTMGWNGFILAISLIYGIFVTNYWYSTVLLVLISILSGINIALIVARAHQLRETGATGFGVLFGLIVGGCPSCATGLLPLLGLTVGVGFLPFGGVEFSVLSVLILLLALYWNATSDHCRVPLLKK